MISQLEVDTQANWQSIRTSNTRASCEVLRTVGWGYVVRGCRWGPEAQLPSQQPSHNNHIFCLSSVAAMADTVTRGVVMTVTLRILMCVLSAGPPWQLRGKKDVYDDWPTATPYGVKSRARGAFKKTKKLHAAASYQFAVRCKMGGKGGHVQ